MQSKVHKSCCFDYHYQSSSNPLLLSLNPSLAICMTIILSIIHLHLRCHLVQSFSEFGVVLPISHCTRSWRLDVPSRKIVEPWKRVRLSLVSSLFCCLNCARGGHTGDGICQLSLCPGQFPAHLEPLDSLVDLSLL